MKTTTKMFHVEQLTHKTRYVNDDFPSIRILVRCSDKATRFNGGKGISNAGLFHLVANWLLDTFDFRGPLSRYKVEIIDDLFGSCTFGQVIDSMSVYDFIRSVKR